MLIQLICGGQGESLVVCVVVKIAIVIDVAIAVYSIGGVIAIFIIFIISIIVGETGMVIVIADAITGCMVRPYVLVVNWKGK